ncbi:membrane protein [Actinomadura sp. NBRC 104412]|uniref:DMT family transporter n=1 Tax=Actinomadura sp. NBRC 104412 TaxID=3032203 RepID=UPI0024A1E708|nr:DMT family transporter [Actinomadura sp. NBRC 104412]GLZ08774.1 membrane protein [Actinomadura sp. NBRC 104412]
MSRRGWVLFALMSVLWGIPYLMIKVAVEAGISVPMVVFARTALGAVLLLPPAFWGGRGRGTPAALRRHWRTILVFATLEIIGPWALLSDAERHLSSSMTGLLIAAVPIVGVVLARAAATWNGRRRDGSGRDEAGAEVERLGAGRWAGLLLGLAGVAVLAWPHLGGNARSIGEIMLVVLGYSIAPTILARRLGDVPSLPLTAACLTLAALIYVGPAAATWPEAVPDGTVLAALAGLGVVCTALAFVIFFELIREVGTSRAMVFTYINPAVAVLAGVLFLDEPLTGGIVGAFVLILGGCVLATSRRAQDPPGGTGRPDEPGPDVPADTLGRGTPAIQ